MKPASPVIKMWYASKGNIALWLRFALGYILFFDKGLGFVQSLFIIGLLSTKQV